MPWLQNNLDAWLSGKNEKDQQQALVIRTVLADHDSRELKRAFDEAPQSMLKPIKSLVNILATKTENHPTLLEILHQCLGTKA